MTHKPTNQETEPGWESEGWRQRRIIADRHRRRAHLIETSAWTAFYPQLRPDNEDEWQLTLLAACSGAMPDIVALAIRRVTDPRQPLRRSWLGVDDRGKIRESRSYEKAYHWIYSFNRGPDDQVFASTPIQTAVAGGCAECIRQLIHAGVDLEESVAWLKALPFNVPRVRAGLAICDCIEAAAAQKYQITDWLARVKGWVIWRIRRSKEDRTEKETMLEIYRQVYRAANNFGVSQRISNGMLADLL